MLTLTLGALLITGLFLYLKKKNTESIQILKPSQLDFSQSNQIQEAAQAAPTVSAEAAKESVSASVVPVTLVESEQKLWVIFDEILNSNNDSDPRVAELKNLSPAFREALISKYHSMKMEDRSGRGFIVFLIAKEIRSAEDLAFLQKVYQEAPCMNLADCAGNSEDENAHNAGVDQTTLVYPQIVALYQIEKKLDTHPEILKDPDLRAGIVATLKQAEAFSVPAVSDRAEKIRQKYNL